MEALCQGRRLSRPRWCILSRRREFPHYRWWTTKGTCLREVSSIHRIWRQVSLAWAWLTSQVSEKQWTVRLSLACSASAHPKERARLTLTTTTRGAKAEPGHEDQQEPIFTPSKKFNTDVRRKSRRITGNTSRSTISRGLRFRHLLDMNSE